MANIHNPNRLNVPAATTAGQAVNLAQIGTLGLVSAADPTYGTLSGNGTTNDYVALNALLTSGKLRVGLPDPPGGGPYVCATTLTIPAGVELYALGGTPTIKFTNSSGARVAMGGDGAKIKGIKLDCNRSGTGATAYGVDLSTYSDCVVEDCQIVDAKWHAILGSGDRNKIGRNIITGCAGCGVYVSGGAHWEIEANGLSNEQFGVLLTAGASYNQVRFNRSVAPTRTLSTSDSIAPTLVRWNGYELIGVTYDSHHNQIIGNRAKYTGDNGISCTGYENVIANNVCWNTWYNGITAAGFGNTITGNQIYQPAEYNHDQAATSAYAGINATVSFGGVARRNVITGNTIEEGRAIPFCLYPIKLGSSTYTSWSSGEVLSQNSVNGGLYRATAVFGIYKATTAGTAGTVAPSHTSGDVVDNGGAVTWRFVASNVLAPGDSYAKWVTATAVTANEIRWNGNNVYQAGSTATTGATPPTHTTGAVSDDTVSWTWLWSAPANLDAAFNTVNSNSVRGFKTADTIQLDTPTNVQYLGEPGRIRLAQQGKPTVPVNIYTGNVNPEGNQTAYVGDIYIRNNQASTNGRQLYLFTGSANTSTGWRAVLTPYTGSKTFDPPSVAAAGTTTTTVTVTGAALGDTAVPSFSLTLAGVMLTAYVSASDTVTVVFFNPTAGAVDLASGTLKCDVFQR